MAKQKTAFVCNDCGSDYGKWQGQCSDCGAWNTITEIRLGPARAAARTSTAARSGYAGALAESPDHEVLLDTLKRFGMSSLAGTLPPGAPAQAQP